MKQTVTVNTHLYVGLQLNLHYISKETLWYNRNIRIVRIIFPVPGVDFDVGAVTQLPRDVLIEQAFDSRGLLASSCYWVKAIYLLYNRVVRL